jgi:hypothetical protein
MPYERFVILLKSRSHTHHPHMHYSYTKSRRKNMHSIQIHQKCFTPTLEVNNKIILHRFPSINALSFFVIISQKIIAGRRMSYAKVIHKKEKERKKRRKN